MKAGFLFGAGAEIDYGLPSGGKFALEIFRQDNSLSKIKFKKNRDDIDSSTAYAADWLPDDYKTKSVGSYGKTVFESIIKDTIEHHRDEIITKLNDFDTIAFKEEEKLSLKYKNSITKIIESKLMGKRLNNCNMKQEIAFIPYFSEGNKIFESKYLSALLKIYKDKELLNEEKRTELRKILVSVFQLQIGALSENLTRKINDGIFSRKDDEIDFFDDIGDILHLNYQSTGLTGLEYVMENKKINSDDDDSALLLFARNIIENIYSSVLDYKSLIDSNWHYLYCPREEWAKFCKINIFLYTVREYIKSQIEAIKTNNDGYYHDLKLQIKNESIQTTTIATTNYNVFIEEVLKKDICYLNGSTNLWYDPYLNRIGEKEQLDKKEIHLLVPLLFTQSGTKPMTCIEMSRKYVKMYDDFKSSDLIYIIGFGFNSDDEHINGILRTLIDIDNKQIVVIDRDCRNSVNNIAKKLKTVNSKNIHLIKVDEKRSNSNINWLEIPIDTISSMQ